MLSNLGLNFMVLWYCRCLLRMVVSYLEEQILQDKIPVYIRRTFATTLERAAW